MKYIEPKANKKSFTCPHCGVFANQDWHYAKWGFYIDNTPGEITPNSLNSSKCNHCEKYTLWVDGKMYYPDTGNAPFPNMEMPKKVKQLYLEAASIQSKSPRGAAALLRLSIQVLCKELEEEGKNVNIDIGNLVKKGLPIIVQQSLDIVRVTGNDAVHPGQIDTDDNETVAKLFSLVNIIINYMITLPKEVNGIYSGLPENKLKGIDERDK